MTVVAYDQYGRSESAGIPWAEQYKANFVWTCSDNNKQTVSMAAAAGDDQRSATVQVKAGAPKKDHINVAVRLYADRCGQCAGHFGGAGCSP